MPHGDDSALAEIYARSLFDLAEERGQADALDVEFADLVRYVQEQPDFAGFLASPRIDEDTRRPILEKLFRGKLSDLLVDALQVLNTRGRLGILADVYDRYRLIRQAQRGEVDVRVTTASPLTDELRGKLTVALTGYTSAKVRLMESTDPSLLGGMVVRVGDTKLDASVARRLRAVRQSLLRRASQELYSARDYLEGVAT